MKAGKKMKRSINDLRAWMQSTETVSPHIPDDEFKEPLKAAQSDVQAYRNAFEIRAFQKFYRVFSVVFCVVFILILLITISWMPRFGDSAAPASNEVAQRYKAVVTVEDGCLPGGFGSAVEEYYGTLRAGGNGAVPVVKRMGLPDEFVTHGSVPQLQSYCHIDAASIANQLRALLNQ